MANEFLKGYCSKTKQFFHVQLEKIDGKYVATNMVLLTDNEAKKLTTPIKQDSFYTSQNLIACRKCGGRLIGGCSCPETYFNCQKGEYNFSCIYCKNFKIDYSEIKEKGTGTIYLSQNEKVDLSTLKSPEGKMLDEIFIAGGWDASKGGQNNDIDFTVFLTNNTWTKVEAVYYGRQQDDARSIKHYGDNLTGENGVISGIQDDEQIKVILSKIPQKYTKIYFVINVYMGSARHSFDDIRNIYLRIKDKNREYLKYNVGSQNGGKTGLFVAVMNRNSNGSWDFKAVGKYCNASYVDDIAKFCKSTGL